MNTRDVQIGRRLMELREAAGLKQGELARRLRWSSPVLSRIEAGERPITKEELGQIAEALGPAGLKLREQIEMQWEIVPEPSLGDKDAELLWLAETTAKEIRQLSGRPEVKQYFGLRLTRYLEELKLTAAAVINKEYKILFAGAISAGKSTAICRTEGLEIETPTGVRRPVLETGGGGVTICEVHLKQGPGYGIFIEPCDEGDIRRHVADFAAFLLDARNANSVNEDESEGSPGISREVERAIRNMTNLQRKRTERKPDGTVIPRIDEARELAAQIKDIRALSIEILSRMQLHKRDQRMLWHSAETGKPPMDWLQATFEQLNNGRHPDFTLPKRIDVVTPAVILGSTDTVVTLIDTQGIDDLAGRADLEQHFDHSHTLLVLCSSFGEAPSTSIRHLLTRAIESGVRAIEKNTSILVLPRPAEALEMKDNGYPAQTAAEGYDLKADQMQIKLHQLGLTSLPVCFFNAMEDSPEELRTFLRTRIDHVHQSHCEALRRIIEGARMLLENYEQHQTEAILDTASQNLLSWINNNASLPVTKRTVDESLAATVTSVHPRTLYAAVSREGEWHKLSYSHQLSHGSRRIATGMLEPKLKSYKEIANNLAADPQFAEARGLIEQSVRALEAEFDRIMRLAQIFGQSIHSTDMKDDFEFWAECRSQWGPGFRDRVNRANVTWFSRTHSGQQTASLTNLIQEQWENTRKTMRDVLTLDR